MAGIAAAAKRTKPSHDQALGGGKAAIAIATAAQRKLSQPTMGDMAAVASMADAGGVGSWKQHQGSSVSEEAPSGGIATMEAAASKRNPKKSLGDPEANSSKKFTEKRMRRGWSLGLFLFASPLVYSLLQTESSLRSTLHGTIVSQTSQDSSTSSRLFVAPITAYTLYDTTLNYSHTNVYRQWFDTSAPSPPAMLLLTTFGWNHPNQTFGLQYYRGIRQRELYTGIINHPYFHPTAWDEINAGRMELSNSTRYYVFVDRETCGERNYPYYNFGQVGNMDDIGGRGLEGCSRPGLREHFIDEIMTSKVMSSPHSRYVIFDCSGNGLKPHFQESRIKYNSSQLTFVSVSARTDRMEPWDLGLVPPIPHPYNLTARDLHNVESCASEKNRSLLVSYSGRLTGAKKEPRPREILAKLHNAQEGIVILKTYGINATAGQALQQLAHQSKFSAAPRGDNLFSYRFSEIMSCAGIPVVFADKWLWPFSPLLFNWSEAVVILPEWQANETVQILQAIPDNVRCSMRRKVVEVYNKYVKTGKGTVNGVIESLELQST